jgi:hypothetical protein
VCVRVCVRVCVCVCVVSGFTQLSLSLSLSLSVPLSQPRPLLHRFICVVVVGRPLRLRLCCGGYERAVDVQEALVNLPR